MQKVTASIITIGDELLIGQVVDTNSAWMSQQLNNIGVWVQHRVAVGDTKDDIWNALDEESSHPSRSKHIAHSSGPHFVATHRKPVSSSALVGSP